MRFIHIADVHLGAVPDKGQPWSQTRAQELWKSFQRVIREAEREQADLLLIAGDLFHRQPLVRELKEVNYLFGRLSRTQVVLIAGNHDYLHRDSPFRNFEWAENVIFLDSPECESVCFRQLETTVYGFSYYNREITEPLYDDLEPDDAPGCHILLAHGGDERHIPIDKKRLAASGFDYIALGHIHKPQMLVENKMAYSGALEPVDSNDTGVHGYILGEYEDGRLSTEFVPFASREYIQISLESTLETTGYGLQEQLSREIAADGAQNIYKVDIIGLREPEMAYHTEEWYELGNILEIHDLTEPGFSIEELRRQHGRDLIGRYIEKLLQNEGGEVSPVRQQALAYGIAALKKTQKR
ncbi:metallophosphoesterase family protein [Marvinbryantia formatexigens]|nr:DNA repair exonuclease [Marvinbryantia formatexigens]UWO23507.1 DNA repair exonuclease [Marvinbryantia formatexigens DSM 14469]SDG55952.1 DNA repair exonuclease SbcCD nuclease subunit [Marvinbryantia formatexigens]